MKIVMTVAQTAAAFALAMPIAATAQYTGVSHPDETPITNSPETPRQIVPAASSTVPASNKPSPYIAVESAPAVAAAVAPLEPARLVAAAPTEDSARNVDAGIVTEAVGPANQLPIGTLVRVRLSETLSTVTTASGTSFTAQLTEPVKREGRVLLPAGSVLSGLVTDVHGGKRIAGAASIHLRTISITLPDGTKYPLRGQVVDTENFKQVKVDQEGTIVRRDHAGKTAAVIGLTTGSAAVAGALIAGPPGALIGAGVGVGVSTVVWLKEDRQMEIPAEAKITFWLTQPLTVGGE